MRHPCPDHVHDGVAQTRHIVNSDMLAPLRCGARRFKVPLKGEAHDRKRTQGIG